MSAQFTMKSTAFSLVAIAVVIAVFAFTHFESAEALAQPPPTFHMTAAPVEKGSTAPATESIEVKPVLVPVAPVTTQTAPPITPEKVENIVLKWVMVLTSIAAALAGFVAFCYAKYLELRRLMTVEKTNTDDRMSRLDERGEKTRVKTEEVEVKVEKHIAACPGHTPSQPPQQPPNLINR